MTNRPKPVSRAAILRHFDAVRDRPAWNVKRGYGTFLTFEFGEPYLDIVEPVIDLSDVSIAVRQRAARRRVFVHGQWHLWIYMCEWEVYGGTRSVGDSSSYRRADRAANYLNGQKLVDVALPTRGVHTTFTFDLGGELHTRPYDKSSTQWMLFEPDGTVLAIRAGRYYSHGDRQSGSSDWRKFL